MTVFVYEIKRRIHLTLRENGVTTNWNLPMASADFKLYKDVQNNIEFVVRNTDRKPINLLNRTAVVTLTDYHTRKILAQKQLVNVDNAKGIVRLTIEGYEMELWNFGFHAYHIHLVEEDGAEHLLYVDQNENARGYFELKQGYYPGPQPSYEIMADEFTAVIDGMPPSTQYISSAMPGNMQANNNSGLHTLAVYTNEFKGTIWVQGTSEVGSSQEADDWFAIDERTLDNVSGITTFTFQMNLQWVRVKYQPAADNTGDFQKVLFRN